MPSPSYLFPFPRLSPLNLFLFRLFLFRLFLFRLFLEFIPTRVVDSATHTRVSVGDSRSATS